MAKLTDEGENRILNILFGSTAVDTTLYLGLYLESSEPAEDHTLSEITEPSGNGYERKALTRGSWTVVDSLASYAVQSFEATGAWGDVYGYFIATSLDGTGYLLLVEDFSDGPYSITQNGESISVTPKITAS